MGWMWSLCLGGKQTSRKQLRASGSRGRVSNDVTEVHRPLDFFPEPIIGSKAPACVEEYSEPRIGSSKSFLLPVLSKGAISYKSTNLCAQDVDEEASNEYEKELGVNSKHNKGGAEEEDRLREKVSSLRSAWSVTALRNHSAIRPKPGIPQSTEGMRRYWNPAWGYALDAMPDACNNQAERQRGSTPSTRKSFSEILIEAGDSSTTVKGPLALAAIAAAAERAARNPSNVRVRRSSHGCHGYRMASAAGHGSSENLLSRQDHETLPDLQRMIVDFPRLPTVGQQSRRPKIRQEISNGRSELKRPALDSSTIMSTGEGLDFEWARSSTSTAQAGRAAKLCKDVMGLSNSPSSTFLIDVPGPSKALSSVGKHADMINPPHTTVHTIPLLQVGSRDSSFCHSESHVASGVAASKEGRLQWHKDLERLIHHRSLALPRATTQNGGRRSVHKRFGKLFRSSSKKRSLSLGSRPFRRPLSPVPEALSLDESLWTRSNDRANDYTDQTAPSTDNLANHAKDLINASMQKLGLEFVNSSTSGKKTSSRSTGASSSPLHNDGEDRIPRPVSPLKSSSMTIPVAGPESSCRKHNFEFEQPREIGQWEAEKLRSYKHIGGLEYLQPLKSSELTSSGFSQSGLVLSEDLDFRNPRTPETISGGGSFLKFVGGRRNLVGSETAELRSSSTSSSDNLQRFPEVMVEQEAKEPIDHGSTTQFEDWNLLRKSAIGKGSIASPTQLTDNYGSLSGTTNDDGVVRRDEERENGSITTSMQVSGRSAADSKTSTNPKSHNFYQDDANARNSEGNACVIEIKGGNGTTQLSDHYQRSPGPMGTKFHVLTPPRDPQVTPEVFISPKGCHKDLTFTRLLDINLEDRPIFGTIADHWEAASWSTKRQTWDGKGIPNSTNKYKEDQKVSFHATPFEERLAQALATQEIVSPRKLFDVSATNVLSDTSLEAH